MAKEKFEIQSDASPSQGTLVDRERWLVFLETLIIEKLSSCGHSACVSGKRASRLYRDGMPLFLPEP
ncbi:hypothetical protein GH742_08970 [Legionella sp. MW5194]|uniref:hypothetical protein n=1 Tax=Legionella sp. MW5194 TaxID=2662448 RepID=UPI00193CC61B|nr:hypothetical protein [Legionella sp. MW5194]QRN03988.1 hypothetical protein GH742_08970 [Legionella sp. MW5194]